MSAKKHGSQSREVDWLDVLVTYCNTTEGARTEALSRLINLAINDSSRLVLKGTHFPTSDQEKEAIAYVKEVTKNLKSLLNMIITLKKRAELGIVTPGIPAHIDPHALVQMALVFLQEIQGVCASFMRNYNGARTFPSDENALYFLELDVAAVLSKLYQVYGVDISYKEDWLNLFNRSPDGCAMRLRALAVENGDLALLKECMRGMSSSELVSYLFNEHLIGLALKHGHIEILTYIRACIFDVPSHQVSVQDHRQAMLGQLQIFLSQEHIKAYPENSLLWLFSTQAMPIKPAGLNAHAAKLWAEEQAWDNVRDLNWPTVLAEEANRAGVLENAIVQAQSKLLKHFLEELQKLMCGSMLFTADRLPQDAAWFNLFSESIALVNGLQHRTGGYDRFLKNDVPNLQNRGHFLHAIPKGVYETLINAVLEFKSLDMELLDHIRSFQRTFESGLKKFLARVKKDFYADSWCCCFCRGESLRELVDEHLAVVHGNLHAKKMELERLLELDPLDMRLSSDALAAEYVVRSPRLDEEHQVLFAQGLTELRKLQRDYEQAIAPIALIETIQSTLATLARVCEAARHPTAFARALSGSTPSAGVLSPAPGRSAELPSVMRAASVRRGDASDEARPLLG